MLAGNEHGNSYCVIVAQVLRELMAKRIAATSFLILQNYCFWPMLLYLIIITATEKEFYDTVAGLNRYR